MDEEDFRRAEELFRRAGFRVEDKGYHQSHFGSWSIVLSREGLPQQRVVWDGRDRWLIVEAFASSGTWMDKWIGRKKSEQNAETALAHLEVPVSREWEQQIEHERAEYWRRFQLEQAISSADRLWEAGCYADYVRELSPYRDQLSPAQLKRMEIAQRRSVEG
jgi:hypothetical protein